MTRLDVMFPSQIVFVPVPWAPIKRIGEAAKACMALTQQPGGGSSVQELLPAAAARLTR
jgi:hypothetical protein